MSNFGLLTSVSKKMFPNGVAFDVSQRLDSMSMAVFNGSGGINTDKLNGNFKGIQSQAMNIFNAVGTETDSLKEACKEANMEVEVKSIDSQYQLGENDNKISAYTFKDKYGNEVTITNANAKEYIQHEREVVDDLLQSVINEVATGEITLPEVANDTAAAA